MSHVSKVSAVFEAAQYSDQDSKHRLSFDTLLFIVSEETGENGYNFTITKTTLIDAQWRSFVSVDDQLEIIVEKMVILNI